MKIGVDVDGVLTNLEEYQIKYGKKYFKKPANETEIDISGIFNVDKVQREKFWLKYIWKYCISEPPKNNSAETIRRLKAEGNEIHIITGRAHTTEKGITGKLFRHMLKRWFKKWDIPYDSITYCKEKGTEADKVKACNDLKIDVLIDDKKENIIEVSKDRKVICIDAKYNQGIEGNNITRVTNFNQVYDAVKRIENINYFEEKTKEDISKMSNKEKRVYFTEVKKYLSNLPFDSKLHDEHEKNYRTAYKVFQPMLKRRFKLKVFNRELVPKDIKGLLFVANHNNYYDQFPIMVALEDSSPIHFLTATKMLKMKRGKPYIATGAISVDRDNPKDRENSSLEIKKLLTHDRNVFIFPEGRTNRKEAFLLDFKPGAMAIARDTGCTVVPVAVNDNYKKEQGDLCVRFGSPFIVKPEDDIILKTAELKKIIGKLKQENIDYVESKKLTKRKH